MKKLVALLLCLALGLSSWALAEPVSQEEQAARVQAMTPVLDSLLRSVYVDETGQPYYNPADPEFFWSVLYLMGVNWSYGNPLCSLTEDQTCLRVPRQMMQEYASAAFLEYEDLLPLPEDSSVCYDEEWDAYLLPLSDMGDSALVINGYLPDQDGALRVYASLEDWEKQTLCSLMFTLVDNPYVEGIDPPTFWYTVARVEPAAG